ncbi:MULTISPECIES: non-ribosomal peptide synthetase [Cyanophyceae]|uniref:non-ribosomal peptide synthetase n=1 Tax=Cyanophyceae TaxID=3028117 RepID=UPI001684F023|nr:non-ribosomal peptide synthetase [Trichocoleus sp. FACHB-40]MBD2002953.1 amino acid adenylation domain-containing protein [Trichocoleus sp. FACHB-40]
MAQAFNNFPRIPHSCSTLVELLRYRSATQPEQIAFTFLQEGETQEISLTYRDLDGKARAIASQLQTLGLSGERALLLYPPGLDYIAAFLGCLYAGVIAVPAYPPRNQRNTPRILSVLTDAQAAIALTTTAILSKVQSLIIKTNPVLKWLATDNLTPEMETTWQEPLIEGDTLAFLQYTSGSTGTPKGVMVSHSNLLHNATMTYQFMGNSPSSIYVSWLPVYHDMGLIGCVLQALYGGFPCIMMSPASFLQSPYRWLQVISHYRATTSGAPNFAYELCIQKITPEQRSTLDLSSWSVAFNGAEPIRQETLERFALTFAECGFRPESFYPCYGMAEATLMVSGGAKAALPITKTVQKTAFLSNRIIDAQPDDQNSQRLVSCGQTLPEQQILIANPETLTSCSEDEIGEIWVSGPSICHGYWNRPFETEQTFHAYLSDTGKGPFLRTGDLGFLQNGELFVTGRAKDLIIIRGRNLYPQDIELTAERSHPALRLGSGAAFSVEVKGEEQLVVVQELEFRAKPNVEEVIAAIRQAITEEHQVQVYAVILIKAGSIPKTSSGKIQRRATRAAFLADTLEVAGSSILNSTHLGKEIRLTRESLVAIASEEQASALTTYLQEVVAQVLGVPPSQINPQQPLSSLGLDSLRVFALKNRIESDLEVIVSVSDIFEGLCITQLVAHILSQLTGEASRASLLFPIEKPASGHPLSFSQQQLWLVHQLEPNNLAYNIPIAIHLKGELNVTALEQSLNEIIHRHEILRTNIRVVDGQPVQAIAPTLSLNLPKIDLRSLSQTERETEAQRLTIEAAKIPFDLSRDRLFVAKLLHLTETEYILILTLHHIISDGWSMGVLLKELIEIYTAFATEKTSPLPKLPIQYVDFYYWQRQLLQGEILASGLNYWTQQLAGNLPVLNLPTDRPRPAIQTFKGARQKFILPKALTEAIKLLSQKENVTLFMALLAAFKTLVHRYTGQEDIIIGSPIANRNRVEFEQLIGFFVNTLVLRTDLAGNPSFRELLRRVREVALGAYAHQDLSFEQLVESLHLERNLSHNFLFQVMFILQPALKLTAEISGLTLDIEEIDNETAKFDLTLSMEESQSGLTGFVEYNTDLFDVTTISRMLGHFQTLLEGIVANPDQHLSELPLLKVVERDQLLVEWNRTQTDYPKQCIHELFEAQVERSPDTVAVCQDQQLTYQELNQRANQLAHHLRSLGVSTEVQVGIYVERSLSMVVGLLGILKAGGAYVPLDPAYPQERLNFILQDCQVSVLLTTQHLVERLPQHEMQVVCIDAWDYSQHSKENPVSKTTADNLAYVIYTSGSTGMPKGVLGLHRGAVNRFHWMWETYPFMPGEVCCQKTSLSFVDSVWEIFGPLLQGVRTVIIPDRVIKDPQQFIETLERDRITRIVLVPSLLRVLLDTDSNIQRLPKLKFWVVSGEALSVDLWQRFRENLPESILLNLYGSSEVSADVTCCTNQQSSLSIGRPIANTQVYLLDAHLQPVPIGVPGELYIGGAGLARGYLNRPDLTAEKFILHSFTDEPKTRLYKTGDIARYLPNGDIEYIGRSDHQVKIRGFRIELGEIEVALRQHPMVKEAVVLVKEDKPGDKYLVACVVPTEETPTISCLRRFLKLPEYMIPATFAMLSELPRTPNGKVDRQALQALETRRQHSDFVAARTYLEEIVAGIWAKILGLEQVGIYDNFFELGGHSLLATQVVSQLRQVLEIELPVRCLFESPTVSELSHRIEATMKLGQKLEMPIERVSRTINLPLSFAQARLWFLEQLQPGTAVHNIPAAVRLSGSLNVAALEQSFNEIIKRHEALRTVFVTVDGQPFQAIAPSLTLTLPVVDLRRLPTIEQDNEVQRLATQEAQRPFDLTQGMLLRGTLLQLDETEYVLLLTMHHIIFDAWSIGVLIGELAALYKAFCAGVPSPLPDLSIQYADFAVWQQERSHLEVLESQLAYWKKQLAGLPVLELPGTKRPASLTNQGATHSFLVSSVLSQALKTLSRQEGVTLFMTLLAAFEVLLQRYTGLEDIVVGTDVANRNRAETEPLIGFFVNLLVLRTNLAGNPSFRELLGRVREVALQAYAHQDLPFAKLVEALRPERKGNHTPLFQILFVLQNAPMPALELPGLSLKLLDIDSGTAKFDLALLVSETEQGIVGTWNYRTDLFEKSAIARMSGHLETLLESIVAQPDARINTLEMLNVVERTQQAASKKERKESKLKQLMNIQPKAVSFLPEKLIQTEFLGTEETLPLVIKPNVDDIDLIDWAKSNREFLETKLLHHGAILFRNFRIASVLEFESFAQAIATELFAEYGDLPRVEVSGKVYGSTPYPPEQPILFHNESSHLHCWPLKIWFFCVQPAQQGGETPIVDCRKVYQLLDPRLREKFQQKQLMYVRNYTENFDVSWQEFFHTNDKAVVEEYCHQAGIAFEWLSGNGLRTRLVRPAVAKHPKTNELVFFNQLQLHHASCLDPAVRESLLSLFGEDQLPRHVYYGDGSPIEDSVIAEIRAVYQEAAIAFPWQQGDVLMLDNMLAAHSRNPYVGSRKIVVALGELMRSAEIKYKAMVKANAQ